MHVCVSDFKQIKIILLILKWANQVGEANVDSNSESLHQQAQPNLHQSETDYHKIPKYSDIRKIAVIILKF